ncbi:WD40-repeat-containing domain protein [Radiomyces spectabilis]|uniref:WD40-repeat-containing domain protein n=1 Tax=Radiomyces spectabilis TaxID=64574 RepID=UPI00221F3C0E|nr:WD40-repeat-containing domain protein [Radiomyces spectabilis]KAI8377876.1 WD40-repeat-containing domain protein [Radiomyces spectabilis]
MDTAAITGGLSPAVDDAIDESGQPLSEWNPPSGIIEQYYFDGAPITKDQVQSMIKHSKIREYKGHKEKVHTVAWNSDGRKLASGSVDKTARVWTPHRGTDIRYSIELKGHTDSVDQLDWDPTHPDRLATASCDKTVRIWDQRSGKCTAVVQTGGENINICWSPDGNHIAVGDKNDTISIIDTRTNTTVKTQKHNVEVNEIAWNNANNLFFVTTGQGTVKTYEYPSLKLLQSLRGHTANCYCVEADPTGKYLAVGSADALVTLWDTKTFTCQRAFSELTWPVRTLSFSYDGQFIASASEDNFIDISHVESNVSVHHIECSAAMNTVAWHPRDYYLAYAGDEMTLDGKFAGNLKIFSMKDPRHY